MKDISQRLEQNAAFEQRAGVRLEGLFAGIDDDGNVVVNGELHVQNGDELSADVVLKVTVHDAQGRVLGVDSTEFFQEGFFQFEPFSVMLSNLPSEPARIRIYPKQ